MSTGDTKLTQEQLRAREAAARVHLRGVTYDAPTPTAGELALNTQPWKTAAQEEAELKTQIEAAVMMLDEAISRTPADSEVREQLERLKDRVKGARTLDALNGALSEATATISKAEASGHMETPAQKKERLWGEIGRLNTEITNTLRPHMNDEEKAKEEEFERRIAAARTEEERLAVERERNRWREGVAENLQHHGATPEARSAGAAARLLTSEQRKKIEALKQLDRGRHTNSAEPHSEQRATSRAGENGRLPNTSPSTQQPQSGLYEVSHVAEPAPPTSPDTRNTREDPSRGVSF